MASDAKRTFNGSCVCGNIKYTLDHAFGDSPTASRCNCTICQKIGFTSIYPESPSDFKLVSPASKDELATFVYLQPEVKRYFCDKCGTHVWGGGISEFNGEKFPWFAVNIQTLDQPQDGLDLSEFKLVYWDALHDNLSAGKKEGQPWPNGLI